MQVGELAEGRELRALVVAVLPLGDDALGLAEAVVLELEVLELAADGDRLLAAREAHADGGVQREGAEGFLVRIELSVGGQVAEQRPLARDLMRQVEAARELREGVGVARRSRVERGDDAAQAGDRDLAACGRAVDVAVVSVAELHEDGDLSDV